MAKPTLKECNISVGAKGGTRDMSRTAGKKRITMSNAALFIDGNGSPLTAKRYGRNSPCRCGSGKKTKACCGESETYYHSKKNEKKRDKN